MTTIGYATLQIIPSLKGVSAEINKQLAAMPDVGTNAGKKLGANIAAGVGATGPGKKIGKELESGVADGADKAAGQVKTRLSERLGAQVGSVVGKGIGAGIKLGIGAGTAAATAAVGGIAVALKKGFDRLQSIDQAKFKLQALGNSAKDVQTIMDNALASVKGTAFGLQDAATAAASAVAAGIKPGQDLTKYLKEVGDAAAVAGTNFDDMGAIFNKIQTSNKAYTDDLQQLSDRGLPIFQWLQKEYGVTGDKLTEMVEKGEVDAAHFQDAIEKNIGGAAQKMGQSFDGAVDNMEASIARLGANFITAILGGDPVNALQGPTEAIGNLTTKFDDIGKWVNEHSGEIRQFFIDIKDYAVQAAGAVKSIGEFLLEHRGILEASVAVWAGWKAISVVAGVAASVKAISVGLGGLGAAAEVGGAGAVAGLSPLVSFLASNPVIAALAAGTAFGAGIGPLLNAGPDAANQKKWDDFNRQQRENAAKNRVPAVFGPTSIGQGPGLPPSGPQLPVRPPGPAGTYDPNNPLLFPYGRATGGSIFGPGTATSDSIPALLSNGEHVWTADEVNKLGGQSAMYRLRGMVKSGLLKGFDTGGAADAMGRANPGMIDILLGRGGQRDNWANNNLFDPMQRLMLYRNMVGVDPSGLRTPGGGIFNQGMKIDTSNVSVSPPPKYGYDQWRLTPEDLMDATTWEPGERDNPTFYKRQAISKNDPLWSWILEKGGGFVGGGAVDVDALKNYASGITGGKYVRGGPPGLSGTDCSGAQAAIANFITGGSGRFATAGEAYALASRGFQPGDPPPGVPAYWVGWVNGGPGGGHTSGTIVDPTGGNVNVEMGGASGGGAYGGPAGGAARFKDRAWIAIAGRPDAKMPVGGEDPTAPDNFSGGDGATSGGFSLPSSFSGLSGFGLSGLGKGVGTTGSGSDLSVFGNAAASAVGGQVSSLAGVLGASDTPGFLKAASQLVGGISIGGGSSSGGGDMHGSRAGQAPGPTYNIYARDAEDALTRTQRFQDQRTAAKLSVY